MKKPWLETVIASIGVVFAVYVGDFALMNRGVAVELALPCALLGALAWRQAWLLHKAGKSVEKPAETERTDASQGSAKP